MAKKVKILSAEDEFEVAGVNEIYENMMNLLKEFGIKDVNETYFQQDLDSKSFKSIFKAEKKLDNQTKLILDFVIFTKDTPKETEKGLYGTLSIKIEGTLEISEPEEWIFPKVLNKIFYDIWWNMLYKKQYEYWEEKSFDIVKKIMKKIRDYYDLIPPAGKVKRLHYKPIIK